MIDDPKNPPPPLDYQSPPDEAIRKLRQRQERVFGIVLSFGAVIGAVFLFIISSLRIGGPSPSPLTAIAFPVACAIVAGGTLVGIAYYRWTKRGSKAFAAGLLIGLCLAMLVEGLCFAMLH